MFNLLKVEFYKLKTSKTFYFTAFLNLLQGIIIYAFSENLKVMSGKKSLIFMFDMQSALALGILIGVFASDYIVTEFTSGYIKNLISYGHKRISIFISKSIVYYMGIIIISFIAPVIMAGINTAINGYGEAINFNSLMFLLRLILIMSLVYIAIGSISVLAAFSSKSVNITIMTIVALDFINRIFNIIAIQKPSLEWIYGKFIFSQPGIVLSDKVGAPEILQAVSISLITLFLTTIIGIYAFKKSDIK
jgi:ABC-2 type transport system permease protein